MKTQASRFTYTIFLLQSILIISPLLLNNAARASAQTVNRHLKVQSAESVNKWPSSAKRYALVIGIDQYESAQINRLEGANNDAKAISNALIENAGFPSSQVILLSTDQPAQYHPTRNNIPFDLPPAV